MNTTLDTSLWFHTASEYPEDQQRDLHDGYWAGAGRTPGPGWSWTIIRDSEDMDGGWSATEDEAKEAVQDWAEADLTITAMAAEMADQVIAEAMVTHGTTRKALDAAAIAVASSEYL